MTRDEQQQLRADMQSAIQAIIREYEHAAGLRVSNFVYGGEGDFTMKTADNGDE